MFVLEIVLSTLVDLRVKTLALVVVEPVMVVMGLAKVLAEGATATVAEIVVILVTITVLCFVL